MLRAELSLWLATETMAARPLLICWGKWSALRADTALSTYMPCEKARGEPREELHFALARVMTMGTLF